MYRAIPAAVLALTLLAGCGGDASRAATASPPASPPALTGSSSADGLQETTPPPPDVTASYTPRAADFTMALKVLEKQCFGSAGCNVTFRVDFTEISADVPDDGTFEVTYEVRGGEDGPLVGTIEVEDGKYSPKEDTVSTASSSRKLTVVITDVGTTG